MRTGLTLGMQPAGWRRAHSRVIVCMRLRACIQFRVSIRLQAEASHRAATVAGFLAAGLRDAACSRTSHEHGTGCGVRAWSGTCVCIKAGVKEEAEQPCTMFSYSSALHKIAKVLIFETHLPRMVAFFGMPFVI